MALAETYSEDEQFELNGNRYVIECSGTRIHWDENAIVEDRAKLHKARELFDELESVLRDLEWEDRELIADARADFEGSDLVIEHERAEVA